MNWSTLSEILRQQLLSPVFLQQDGGDYLRSIQDSFGGATRQTSQVWNVLGVLFLGGLVVLLCWNLISQYRQRLGRRGRPAKVFNNLVGGLSLTPDEKRLLLRIARGARLRHPTMLLLGPDLLDWGVGLWQKEKGRTLQAAERQRVRRIRTKLFEDIDEVQI